jgi:hypothetical protein
VGFAAGRLAGARLAAPAVRDAGTLPLFVVRGSGWRIFAWRDSAGRSCAVWHFAPFGICAVWHLRCLALSVVVALRSFGVALLMPCAVSFSKRK